MTEVLQVVSSRTRARCRGDRCHHSLIGLGQRPSSIRRPSKPKGSQMSIAILGTGKVGSALGARLASVGHHVVYGSRTPTDGAGTVSQREAMAVSRIRSTESR
nr:NAD(P)-binding domain-containing protein [Rhodococcus sp. MS16]